MGNAKIAILLKDGKIAVSNSLEAVNGAEMAELIINLKILQENLEQMYKEKFMRPFGQ